jgi:hypothetical protein
MQQSLVDLSAAELSGIDILFVQNPINTNYGAEYLANLTNVQNAVNAGLILIIHDRYVTGAKDILPGGQTFNIVRYSDAVLASNGPPKNIDILDATSIVANGITNTSLDGGNQSNHGYATSASLPADAKLLLSNGDPTQIVMFSYAFGAGQIIYSTIPMDFYLSASGTLANNMKLLAQNVVAYAESIVVFRNLAAPVITFRTLQTLLSGKVSFNGQIPVGGQVLITVQGSSGTLSQNAVIQQDGTFGLMVPTQNLSPANPGYQITYSYPGNGVFPAISGSTLLIVAYGDKVLSNQTTFNYPGSTVQVRIQALDVFGNNLTNANLQVLASRIRLLPNGTPSSVTNSGVNLFPKNAFNVTNINGQLMYQFNVKTESDWQTGTYELSYTIGNDPTIHIARFRVELK